MLLAADVAGNADSNDCINQTFIPHECSAVHFYRCIDGRKTRMRCPDGTYFDAENLICDWPPHGRCQTFFGKDCTSNSVYFPDRDDPNSFYQCSNGVFYRFLCPTELEFNKELNVCDWPKYRKIHSGESNKGEAGGTADGFVKRNHVTAQPIVRSYPTDVNEFLSTRDGWVPVVGAVQNQYSDNWPTPTSNRAGYYSSYVRWPEGNAWEQQQDVLDSVTDSMAAEVNAKNTKATVNCSPGDSKQILERNDKTRSTPFFNSDEQRYNLRIGEVRGDDGTLQSVHIVYPEPTRDSDWTNDRHNNNPSKSSVRVQSNNVHTPNPNGEFVDLSGDGHIAGVTVAMSAGNFEINTNHSDFYIHFNPNTNFVSGPAHAKLSLSRNNPAEGMIDIRAELLLQNETANVHVRTKS